MKDKDHKRMSGMSLENIALKIDRDPNNSFRVFLILEPVFMKHLLLLFCCFSVTHCATHLPGYEGQDVDVKSSDVAKADLEISIESLDDLTSDSYRAFAVSFLNNSDQWKRIEQVNIAFPALSQAPNMLLGKDLSSYLEAVSRRNLIEQHNRQLWMTGLALASLATAAGSKNPQISTGAAGLFTGIATYESINQVLNSKDRAEFQGALPDQHLLKSFDIPPHLSMSRWFVINLKAKESYIEALVDVTSQGSAKKTFKVIDRRNEWKQIMEAEKKTKRSSH